MKLIFENWRNYTSSILNEDLLIESYEQAQDSVFKRATKLIKGWVYQHNKDVYDKIEQKTQEYLENIYSPGPIPNNAVQGYLDYGMVLSWLIGGRIIFTDINNRLIPHDITEAQKKIALLWSYRMFIEQKIVDTDLYLKGVYFVIKKIYDKEDYPIEIDLFRSTRLSVFDLKGFYDMMDIFYYVNYDKYKNLTKLRLIENFFHWNQFIRDGKKDLNSISDYDELYEVVEEAKPLYQAWQKKQDNKDTEAGKEYLLNNQDWLIYAIHNKGAARQFGSESDLCTAAPGLNYFETYYKENDPLFAIIDLQNNEKFQFSFGKNDLAYLRPSDRKDKCFFDQTRASKEQLDKIMPVLDKVVPEKYQIAREYIQNYMQ